MRTAILGAGALGSVIGGALSLAGRAVELWDLNDDHINAINCDGLILDGPNGRDEIRVPACHPEDGGDVDAIILLTKTLHTEAALKGVAKHIEAGATVLTAQNGLGNAEKVAALVPKDQVLYGLTMMPGRMIGPGHVASQSTGQIYYTSLTENGWTRAEALAIDSPLLRLTHEPNDTDRIIWQKVAFNCAVNAICALGDGPMGLLARVPDAANLARDVAIEVLDIAELCGIQIHPDEVLEHLDRAIATNTAHKPSMLQDIEARRPTEIDSLCGAVVRRGEAIGVETPLNRALAALVTLKSNAMIGDAA